MSKGRQQPTKAGSFYSHIYGSDSPSATRRFFINSILVVVGLNAIGLYIDFVPSGTWSEISWRIAFSMGAAITVFVWSSYWTGDAKFKAGTSGWRIALFFVLTPPVSVLFIWGALTHGSASLVALSLGQEAVLQRELKKDDNWDRRACGHRLRGEFIEPAFPSHYCLNPQAYESLPDRGTYLITGRQHFLGFIIESVSLAERQSE
ncbi:MAG: hypothetical protein AAGI72_24555 [Pseudomonadota bacterium]